MQPIKITEEQARAAYAKYKTIRGTCSAIRIGPMRLKRLLGDVGKSKVKTTGVSVSSFLDRYDYERLLRSTIAQLCQESFIPDSEIRLHCGIPTGHFRRVAEQDEFAECQIRDAGKIWWSTKQNVSRVRAKQAQWGITR